MADEEQHTGEGGFTRRERRPGRVRAGSSTSGRLVAASSSTPVRPCSKRRIASEIPCTRRQLGRTCEVQVAAICEGLPQCMAAACVALLHTGSAQRPCDVTVWAHLEAVQLREQLVQRLVPLLVEAQAPLAACAPRHCTSAHVAAPGCVMLRRTIGVFQALWRLVQVGEWHTQAAFKVAENSQLRSGWMLIGESTERRSGRHWQGDDIWKSWYQRRPTLQHKIHRRCEEGSCKTLEPKP